MCDTKLFKARLTTIFSQLSKEQAKELINEDIDTLSPEDIKLTHDKFIELQYSSNPTLCNEDIRGVIVSPFKD